MELGNESVNRFVHTSGNCYNYLTSTSGVSNLSVICLYQIAGRFFNYVRRIKLTKGQWAVVDDEDYKRVSQHKWCVNNDGYAVRGEYMGNHRTKAILMHRFLARTPDGLETDHRNTDRLDNRKSNLRTATKQQNQMNSRKLTRASSQYKGVSYDKRSSRWDARIKVNYRSRLIGLFTSEIAAAMAYDIAARDLFGEYARLNFKPAATDRL